MLSQSSIKRSHNGSVKYSSYNSSSSNMPFWGNGMNGEPQSMYGGNEGNTFWGNDNYCGNSNFGNSGMGMSGMSNNCTPFSKSGVLSRVGGYEEPRGRGLLRSSQGNGGNSYMMQRSGLLNTDSFSMGRSGSSDGSYFSMGRSESSGGGPFSMRRPDSSSNFSMSKPLLECLPSHSGSYPFQSNFGSMGFPQYFHSNKDMSGMSVLSRVSEIEGRGASKMRTKIKKSGAKKKKKKAALTAAVPADVESFPFESEFKSMGLPLSFHSNKERSSFSSSQGQNKTPQSSGMSVLSRDSKVDGGGGSKMKARVRRSGAKKKQRNNGLTAAVSALIGRPPLKGNSRLKKRLMKSFSHGLQEDFPVEALHCHMCRIEVFSTVEKYVEHVFSENHRLVAELFHAKMAATLELLSTSAKLAERRIGIFNPYRRKKRIRKQTERVLFDRMMRVKMCCDKKFDSHFDLEEHKLTLSHLKIKYEISNKKDIISFDSETEKEDSIMNNEEGASAVIPEIPNAVNGSIEEYYALIDEAKEFESKTPLTSANMPAYDAGVMFGLQFIEKAPWFACSICKNHTFKGLRLHCQSPSHYDNVVKHINNIEEMERKARKALEAEQAEVDKEERVNPEGASVEISTDNIEISADNLEVMDSIDANGEEAEEVYTEIPSGEEKIETIIHDLNLGETDVIYEEFGEDSEEEDAHPTRRRSLRSVASGN